MISYLQGKIIFKKEQFIILNVDGIGFKVFFSKKLLGKIPQLGEILSIFCYLDVGERSLKLYGFLSYKELEFFEALRNVSGIGPRAALEICSVGPVEETKKEIMAGNEKIFENISGIGAKKARKIILELSGKLKNFNSLEKGKNSNDGDSDIFAAFLGLGFKKAEIKKALSQIPEEAQSEEEKIKTALAFLGKK